MEFLPQPDAKYLTPARLSVEREVLALTLTNVGLHGTSSYRDSLIEISRSYNPPNANPESIDFGFTYYSLIDPERMKRLKLHPLFFSYAINLARAFAHKAVREDGEKGIPSRPIYRVMTNMQPETVIEDYRNGELIDFEAREENHGLYEKTIGKIDESDDASFVYDADVIDHDTRFMQRLVPILLRPQSPVQG